jgi:large subunit ribosomal protein L23
MAIFSKKPEQEKSEIKIVQSTGQADDKGPDKATDQAPAVKTAEGQAVVIGGRGNKSLVFPRLSEKASALGRINKYVFKIEGKVNKVELRKALEKAYGIKIAQINMISMRGKSRRYGRTTGKMSDFKKAVVTLTADSKKIDLIES